MTQIPDFLKEVGNLNGPLLFFVKVLANLI